MKIELSPVGAGPELLLDVEGDVVFVNGVAYDFSPLVEGGTLPLGAIDSEDFVSDVTRVDGELHFTLRFPHGPNAPHSTRFPEPIVVTEDGSVELPLYDSPPSPGEVVEPIANLEVVDEH